MSKSPDIIAWCDGSYRGSESKKGGPIGGGFILRYRKTGTTYNCSRIFNALSNCRKQGSMIAEIRAITAALRHAPRSHHIHVCNDNRNIVQALQTRDLGDRVSQTSDGDELKKAFHDAMSAIQRHGHVSFSWRWRNKPIMKMADKLADQATRPPKAKAA